MLNWLRRRANVYVSVEAQETPLNIKQFNARRQRCATSDAPVKAHHRRAQTATKEQTSISLTRPRRFGTKGKTNLAVSLGARLPPRPSEALANAAYRHRHKINRRSRVRNIGPGRRRHDQPAPARSGRCRPHTPRPRARHAKWLDFARAADDQFNALL